ncbi:hypothetical protein PSH03_005389 [Micromonospora sp. PSH03]|uniref:hypothetical protein n=1 Tax=Micromonospora salmantinae TaxID=2911211 RepID=UPI001EE789C1|nr:hypothetical protein [Micromonospora salmantinae]MCG5459606.1 hypothetical protein [Micromonospora salmantinae]
MKRIVVLSDTQIPYHDRKALDAVYRFIGKYQPDEIASVGDDVDFPQVSRWHRGSEMEYRGNLQNHINQGVTHFEALRAVHSGPIHVSRSNHMDRPLNYIRKYAPALMGVKGLTVPELLEFERLGVSYHEQPYLIAPGWLLAHGDESRGTSPTPGGVAMRLARKWGMSVICGHTHKFGMQHDHSTVNGRYTRRLYGVEVGNLMDFKSASYLGAGSANWQQGIAVLYVDGKAVTPSLIPITNGRFTVEGETYS